MKGRLVWSVFWAQVVVFVITVIMMTAPFSSSLHPGLIFVPWGLFFSLGAALTYLTLRQKTPGWQGKFLLTTGAAGVGFLVFVVLHNVVSGIFDAEEPVFFVLATIVCPLGFLVGTVGSIVLAIKNRQLLPGN
jgi:hypothetical protein